MTVPVHPWLCLATLAYGLFFVIGAVLPPLFIRLSCPAWADGLYHLFSAACQQQPSRSFWLWGYPLAVCARCLGLYMGFVLASLSSISRRTLRIHVSVWSIGLLALLEKPIEWFVWPSNNPLRLLSGFALGVVLFLFVHLVVTTLTRRIKHYATLIQVHFRV